MSTIIYFLHAILEKGNPIWMEYTGIANIELKPKSNSIKSKSISDEISPDQMNTLKGFHQ